jgi:hypothetical protein
MTSDAERRAMFRRLKPSPGDAPSAAAPLARASRAKKESVRSRLEGIADSVGRQKDGAYRARLFYFYTHGRTDAEFTASVKAAVPEAVILGSGNHWGNYPAESYFWVRFKLPKEEAGK